MAGADVGTVTLPVYTRFNDREIEIGTISVDVQLSAAPREPQPTEEEREER